ncbi:Gfo/Idh/MocA family oxidoreductase [Vibrio breoganii]
MVNLGVIGFSEGNGHPYSFSAIINGYCRTEFEKTEWIGILNYLEKRHPSEIGSLGARVTHVWSQDSEISHEISRCCEVKYVVDDYHQMIGQVDGVLIARDDFESHWHISKVFLDENIPVFIDKPLTLSRDELLQYKPYYQKGLLMTCSGLRFCGELDGLRQNVANYGNIPNVKATVINSWEKYGIHMLDAFLGIWNLKAKSIRCVPFENFESYFIEFENGQVLQIDAMGPNVITFSFDVFGENKCEKFEIRDNFTSFKRTLNLFINQVHTGLPAIEWESVNNSISILIAGVDSRYDLQKHEVTYV